MASLSTSNVIASERAPTALSEVEFESGAAGTTFQAQNLKLLVRDLAFALDRPGGRALLAGCLSLYASLKWAPTQLQIYHCDDAWVMKDHSGALVFPRPRIFAGVEHALATIDHSTFAHYMPEAGHNVVIVGAGIGLEILRASRLVGSKGAVVGIEAHPNTYRCLQRTCEINGLSNVNLINAAVTREPGEISISDEPDYKSNSLLPIDEGRGSIRIRCDSLGNLLYDNNRENIDFIGMNIEGAEVGALVGMRGLLPRVRRICVGCHDFLADKGLGEIFRTQQWVSTFLRENGFNIWSNPNAEQPWLRNTIYGQKI